VITFKAPTYRSISDDKNLTKTAAIVVIVVSLVVGFFQTLVPIAAGGTSSSISIVGAIVAAIVGVIFGLIAWAIGAWVLAFVAKMLFRGKANTLQMLRVTGYVHVFDLVGILAILGGIALLPLFLISLALVAAVLRSIGYAVAAREVAGLASLNAIEAAVIAIVAELIIVTVIEWMLLFAVGV
jgi:hypothetical protein